MDGFISLIVLFDGWRLQRKNFITTGPTIRSIAKAFANLPKYGARLSEHKQERRVRTAAGTVVFLK
jgi:hypothetical protein